MNTISEQVYYERMDRWVFLNAHNRVFAFLYYKL